MFPCVQFIREYNAKVLGVGLTANMRITDAHLVRFLWV